MLQRDPILAKQLFSAVFAGVLCEMEKVKPREESARIKEQLRVNMNAFLSKSALCFPPFIACVQVQSIGVGIARHLTIWLDYDSEGYNTINRN